MVTPHSFAEIVSEVARKHLRDDLPTATVQARPITDLYGDPGFHLRILYDGHVEKPSPRLMTGLYHRMWPDLVKHGIGDELISHSFIDKTEDSLWSLPAGPATHLPESNQ